MSHPEAPFEPRARAVSFALLLVAAWAAPTISVAHDGTWIQLGAPVRMGSPLLRDESAGRLVLIGADAVAETTELLDAWEFREPSGWRRIGLPRPPFAVSGRSLPWFSDPAHSRFLALEWVIAGGPPRARLWTLEFGAVPQWRLLDENGDVAAGTLRMDERGDAAWMFGGYPLRQLWNRSLADSGAWRLVREVPVDPIGFTNVGVESGRGRLIGLGPAPGGTGALDVWTLTLGDTSGWRRASQVRPGPAWSASTILASDPARDRLVLLAWSASGGTPPDSWALDLESLEWASLGPTLARDPGPACAVGGDTLWGWGRDGPGERLRVTVVPLASPASWRIAYEQEWPRDRWFQAVLHDAAGGRRFFADGTDSLFELTLEGDAARWRRVPVSGAAPAESDSRSWVTDETGGAFLLLQRTPAWRNAGEERDELWSLRVGDDPRWSLEWASAGPLPEPWDAFALEPGSRSLVRLGARNPDGSPRNEAWTLDVDQPSRGWTIVSPGGAGAPYHVDPASAVGDPLRRRIVFSGIVPGAAGVVAGLELSGAPEWRATGLQCDPHACLQQYTRGVFDPIGRRVLQFGGSSLIEMVSYDHLWEIGSGDTLGPLRLLDAMGSPGRQAASPAGYDPSRDALVTFNSNSGALCEFRFDRGAGPFARLRAAGVLADRIRLAWSATPATSFHLWRRAPGADWLHCADLEATSSGELTFDDRAVEAGTRYGYRLTVSPTATETVSADVWVTAATSGTLSLARPWPNPAQGSMTVTFTTGAASPVSLELFDVAGRRVWSRRWDAPAAGPHHVVLDANELPRAGLYFVRLRQAGLSTTRRVVIAP